MRGPVGAARGEVDIMVKSAKDQIKCNQKKLKSMLDRTLNSVKSRDVSGLDI